MHRFIFKPWQILIIGTFFGIVAFQGIVITFRTIVFRPFVPQTITPTTITPTTVEPQKLTPQRELIGTWRGQGIFTRVADPIYVGCSFGGDVEIRITRQTDDGVISGTFTLDFVMTGCNPGRQPTNPWVGVIPNGQITGTRLTFTSPDFGTMEGTFTTDIMTLNQTAAPVGGGWAMSTAQLNLLREAK